MLKQIRVLECIRQGKIGGGESHLLSLAENLDREKFEPVVLSFTEGPMIEKLSEMKVKSFVIHTEKPFDFTKWPRVKQLLKDLRIDIIHAHGTRANSNIIWAARSLKIPVIYTIHGWSFHQDQNALVKWIRVLGEKYLTSRSTLNISVSRSNQESGKKYISSLDSVIINNGINQKKFNPQNFHKDIRAELGIPKEKLLVLFIARFTLHKQPLSLIRAFIKAGEKVKDMHLLLVGEGDEREKAIELIEKTGHQKAITLLPFRQDVPDILSCADIFVLPSLWEGLPIGLLEAMAMGKAVIATNVDGTCEVIENNVNGLLVETDGLIDNLSNAIIDLASDAIKRKQFQKNAISTVNDRYNAVRMTRTIEDIYRQLYEKYHAGPKLQ